MADIHSKLPPQNLEAERAVLGGMLIENDAINRVVEILDEADFYREAHRKIFQAILSLYQANEPSDLVTITNWLKSKGYLEGVGGAAFLATLVDQTPTAAHIAHYAKIIREKSILRRLIDGATDIVTKGYSQEKSVEEFLDEAEKIIFEVASSRIQQGFFPLKDVVKSSFKTIEQLYEKKELITGVPSGFKDLDRLTSGLQPSDLLIVAGRPSSGKTAFSLNIMENAGCDAKVPCAIFSLEMSKEQLVQRLLCSRAKVDSYKLRGGFLAESDWPKLTRAAGALSEAPIFIDDSPMLTVLEMRAKARRLKKEKGLGLLVVDYLQLVRTTGRFGSREQEISDISRNLKALAKELHVPVIALSQLNRGLESRQDKRPMLSDLRESGCLTGDTLITNAKTGEQISIKALAERDGQTSFPVFAVDENYKVRPHKLIKAFSSGRKKVYLLKTRSGRKIKASANHPFLRMDGWKRLDHLRVGDAVALPRKMAPLEPQKHLSDNEIFQTECQNVGVSVLEVSQSQQTLYNSTSDIFWDKIKSITELGVEEVYDATVEGVHNFTANDILVHNSIEQDADVVMMIYRDEMYNTESPEAGKAEVIIGKQRNGPTGKVQLAFLSQFTRFENLARAADEFQPVAEGDTADGDLDAPF